MDKNKIESNKIIKETIKFYEAVLNFIPNDRKEGPLSM